LATSGHGSGGRNGWGKAKIPRSSWRVAKPLDQYPDYRSIYRQTTDHDLKVNCFLSSLDRACIYGYDATVYRNQGIWHSGEEMTVLSASELMFISEEWLKNDR